MVKEKAEMAAHIDIVDLVLLQQVNCLASIFNLLFVFKIGPHRLNTLLQDVYKFISEGLCNDSAFIYFFSPLGFLCRTVEHLFSFFVKVLVFW